MKKRKIRYCKCCGGEMGQDRLWLCDACIAVGAGRKITNVQNNGRDLLEVARERKHAPLEEMGPEEIECLSHEFLAPYNTYGKLRAYVQATGKLPPKYMERSEAQCRRR